MNKEWSNCDGSLFKRETLQFILDESKCRSQGKQELCIWKSMKDYNT